ncbi:hypothetical protein ACPYPG_34300 [Streptomyces sp. FR-108]|uniref:hypothetical protein n=1 Tax=Streptomyces sp. FR-108 TaxID=3416665 RepID=UPI003CF0A81A
MAGEHLPVQLACRVLHVAESGYYAWHNRPPSNRLVKHARLTEAIVGIHAASRGTYGPRRLHPTGDSPEPPSDPERFTMSLIRILYCREVVSASVTFTEPPP